MPHYHDELRILTSGACDLVKVKVKIKFALEQATKSQRGSRGIALLLI
jgi:hypothetical protein